MKTRIPDHSDGNTDQAKREADLIELYNQMIRVAYASVHNKSDAHDVVQEAWLKMLLSRDSLREENKLLAWAKAITRNVASNVNRIAGRMLPFEQIHEEPEAYSANNRPEADIMLEISELLGAMDPTTRTLMLYKFYYGFKDQEIADAMGMPIGTVKAKIHRTREKLRAWQEGPVDVPKINPLG